MWGGGGFSSDYGLIKSFPGSSDGKESSCNAGDPSPISGLGRFPGEGNGRGLDQDASRAIKMEVFFPLQYSCLENPTDRNW